MAALGQTSSALKCLSDGFVGTVVWLVKSNDTTEECLRNVSTCIAQYTNPNDLVHRINVWKLLESMLDGAKISGGERYTACAILACEEDGDPRQKLKDLADDWISFLL